MFTHCVGTKPVGIVFIDKAGDVQTMSKSLFTTKSSTIHRVEYLEQKKILEIEFRSGNVYHYYNFPSRLWKVFQLYIECGGSAGSFFNEYIKNEFNSEKIRETNT